MLPQFLDSVVQLVVKTATADRQRLQASAPDVRDARGRTGERELHLARDRRTINYDFLVIATGTFSDLSTQDYGDAKLWKLRVDTQASSVQAFLRWVPTLGPWGPVAFIAGYALAVVAFVPGSVLTLHVAADHLHLFDADSGAAV